MNAPACSSGSTNLSCLILASNKLAITFTAVQQTNTAYSFTFAFIINPYSFKPASSILVSTTTTDLVYTYSALSTGLEVVNTIASAFPQLSYAFGNQFLSEQTNLTINVTNSAGPVGFYTIQFAPSFQINSTSPIACLPSNFVPLCDLNLNSSTGLYQMKVSSTSAIPLSTTIVLSPLTNPSTIVTDYTTVFSFTADSYLIAESRSSIQFSTFCTFPCRECLSSSRNVCLSCYSASSNLSSRIYLFQSQCVATCPSGYIPENITYTCSACVLPCY